MLETELPKKISVFPLSNAIFFPRTVLPLNIFEKRYIQMVSDSMKENKLKKRKPNKDVIVPKELNFLFLPVDHFHDTPITIQHFHNIYHWL